MDQQLYKGALNDACQKMAKCVLISDSGLSNDIVETLAAKFEDEALHYLDFIVGQDRDPNILTRAVNYLAESQAIPPMGTDLSWFRQMLTCSVELAVPNAGLTSKGAAFLKDVGAGIQESLQDATE